MIQTAEGVGEVWEIWPTAGGGVLLVCQHQLRFALVDEEGAPIAPFELLTPQRTYRQYDTFVLDETGERYRVMGSDPESEGGFDGTLTVEIFPG